MEKRQRKDREKTEKRQRKDREKTGSMYFDWEEKRYNICFGLKECYHGLHRGEGLRY